MNLTNTNDYFSVFIYPPKFEKTGVKVMFESKDEKDTYLAEETHFCKTELEGMYKAILPGARAEARRKVIAKRTVFAIHKGYAVSKTNRFAWVLTPPPDTPILS